MPKVQQKQVVPRQRPVSCRFCRSRKLRCSRTAPCSNCVSRGIECELQVTTVPTQASSTLSEIELVDRVRRLEQLLEIQKLQRGATSQSAPDLCDIETQEGHPSNSPAQIEHLENDVAWLESIYNGLGHPKRGRVPSSNLVFKICPIRTTNQVRTYANETTSPSSMGMEPSKCIWLPEYAEAKILLEKFIRDVDHIHHVVHTPSLASLLEEVYACLDQKRQLQPGNIILLLSIFASATESWNQKDCEHGLFHTPEEANRQSPLWVRATEDVLDIVHRTVGLSIEGIQGILIVSFVVLNSEGMSRGCKPLYNVALQAARDLGLHCLDHPAYVKSSNTLQAEMGRRVWWYLVSSDWTMAARFNGRFPGTYQCHPRQMVVNKPKNIDDEDIGDRADCVGQPLSWPTDMSYSLQRIRLAEICRHLIDRTPLSTSCTDGLSYDTVMDIDTELQVLINELPSFFSVSLTALMEEFHLNATRATNVFHQGYMIRSNTYSQRCKLHLPYFSRGFVDSTYASSREICIQSARLIIRTETELEQSELPTITRYKFIGFFLSIFVASIVLLMDLCHSKSLSDKRTQRSEAADAFRMLEEARHDSDTVARLLDSMTQILRRNKISPPKLVEKQPPTYPTGDTQDLTVAGGTTEHVSIDHQPFHTSVKVPTSITLPNTIGSGTLTSNDLVSDTYPAPEDVSSYFNELAQGLEYGTDLGDFDWDSIFSGLNSSFV